MPVDPAPDSKPPPLSVATLTQVGAVPCGRCGSLQHCTNSTACQLQTGVPSRYTLDGRLKKLEPSRKGATGPPPALPTPEKRKVGPQSPRPVTDISAFPHLQQALRVCRDTW